MKSLFWILIHVAAAVILAVRILRDFHKSAIQTMEKEEKESTRDPSITSAVNDEHGTH